MQILKLTDNSKTKFKSNHLNTFGLNYGLPIHGGTCPGATSGSGGCLHLKINNGKNATCYMAKLVKAYPNLKKSLDWNTQLVKDKSVEELVQILTDTVTEFIKRNKGQQLYFRIHTSGDFYSEDYTKAWHATIKKFPQVQFWVYTRSFFAIPILVELKNLSIYISADASNWKEAKETHDKYKQYNNLGISYMGNTSPDDLRFVKCPEITKKILNTKQQGACSRCKLCFTHSEKIKLRNINFPIH